MPFFRATPTVPLAIAPSDTCSRQLARVGKNASSPGLESASQARGIPLARCRCNCHNPASEQKAGRSPSQLNQPRSSKARWHTPMVRISRTRHP
jgi:hypothetical protein